MNNKGFTLIELIIVTIILGVLAAVAVPRYMGTVSNAEAAAEQKTVAALRAAVENYATQKFLEEGRWSYPSNPFDYVEVDGYVNYVGGYQAQPGDWWMQFNGIHGYIRHMRRDGNVYDWSYRYADMTDLDGDDRGSNVGLPVENPGSNYQSMGPSDYWNQRRAVHYAQIVGDPNEQQDAF